MRVKAIDNFEDWVNEPVQDGRGYTLQLRGRLYTAGQVYDLPDDTAQHLLDVGVVSEDMNAELKPHLDPTKPEAQYRPQDREATTPLDHPSNREQAANPPAPAPVAPPPKAAPAEAVQSQAQGPLANQPVAPQQDAAASTPPAQAQPVASPPAQAPQAAPAPIVEPAPPAPPAAPSV